MYRFIHQYSIVTLVVISFYLNLEKKIAIINVLYRNIVNQFMINVSKRIRTYLFVHNRPQWGTCVVMFALDLNLIWNLIWTILLERMLSYVNGQWDHDRSRHQNYIYRDLTVSMLNQSHMNALTRKTSYPNIKTQRNYTISYDFSIVLFVTDRTTVKTYHMLGSHCRDIYFKHYDCQYIDNCWTFLKL